jgi:hypothetical protein
MSFAMPRAAATVPPPSFTAMLQQSSAPRDAPITSPNTSSGANTDMIGQAAHTRMSLGEPAEPTPPPQFGTPTGQKTQLGQ